MNKFIVSVMVLFMASSFSLAQYKGKYVGWSAGYCFRSGPSAAHYKAFTHLMNFQCTVSGSGAVNTGSLAANSTTFVANCHTNGDKAIVCIGGAGQSANFSAACANASTQATLVHNIVNLVRTYGYDGVDLDWEEGEENGFDGNTAKVAMFKAFHKQIRDSVDKMTPKPMFTAAVATDWYTNGTVAIAPYVDQLNNMCYYNGVNDMNGIFQPVNSRGVAKTLQGVGFGWGTDNEITDPNDILAKCRYAIDNGYGGIMAWDIVRAQTVTSWILDSLARYVTHTPVTFVAQGPLQMRQDVGAGLFVSAKGASGIAGIRFSAPRGEEVSLVMYDVKGALVKTLFTGTSGSDAMDLPLGAIGSGTYVFKLTSGGATRTAKATFTK
jgi:hypothetical protein